MSFTFTDIKKPPGDLLSAERRLSIVAGAVDVLSEDIIIFGFCFVRLTDTVVLVGLAQPLPA